MMFYFLIWQGWMKRAASQSWHLGGWLIAGGKTGQKWRQKKAANMTRRPRFSHNKQTASQCGEQGERDEKKETWKDDIQTWDTKGRGGRRHHMGQMNQPPTPTHELLLTGAEAQSRPASSERSACPGTAPAWIKGEVWWTSGESAELTEAWQLKEAFVIKGWQMGDCDQSKLRAS